MQTTYYLRATNPTDRFIILAVFIAKGFVWHRTPENETTTDIATIDQKWPFDRWPNVKIDFEEQGLAGKGDDYFPNTRMLTEVLELWDKYCQLPKPVKVKLNDTYTATVTADTIEVGCQKFPIGVLDELIKARDSFKRPTPETTPRHTYELWKKHYSHLSIPDGYRPLTDLELKDADKRTPNQRYDKARWHSGSIWREQRGYYTDETYDAPVVVLSAIPEGWFETHAGDDLPPGI